MRPPAPHADAQNNERSKKALVPSEADKILRAWNDDSNKAARNRALIAVLLLTGMRRSEAAALQWRNVDFQNGVITIRHAIPSPKF